MEIRPGETRLRNRDVPLITCLVVERIEDGGRWSLPGYRLKSDCPALTGRREEIWPAAIEMFWEEDKP